MFTAEQRTQLVRGAAEWDIILSDAVVDRFERFAIMLDAANAQFNLTRIAPNDIVTLHFLDSLALCAVLTPEPETRLIDVGTGAGFPGLPLAIVFPELQVTLLDSTRKRLDFLDSVIAELGLSQAQTLHGRAEELGRDALRRESYDLVTARAVARMPTLAGWLLPLARPGGLTVAYKSRDAGVEIEAARPQIGAMGGKIERVADVLLPGAEIVRKLALIRKVRHTPLRPVRSRAGHQ